MITVIHLEVKVGERNNIHFFFKAEFTTCHDYLYMINIRIEVEKCDILSYKSRYFEVVMV